MMEIYFETKDKVSDLAEEQRLDIDVVETYVPTREIEKRQAREKLEYQASHDALTGLPNRVLLADRLQLALLHAGRQQNQVAILFVDLDNFKFINDSMGHNLGDRLLTIIGRRLTESVRADDTVARHGGDEFVVILPVLRTDEDVVKVVEKIRIALGQPLRIDEHEMELSCSIGVGIFPKDGRDAQELLRIRGLPPWSWRSISHPGNSGFRACTRLSRMFCGTAALSRATWNWRSSRAWSCGT